MAGVFGNLFDEEGVESSSECYSSKTGFPAPSRPRGQCGLGGIDNQGATCYLNSLLQTLLFTPEFRDGLFNLSTEELGKLEDADKPKAKVRVIPIQLQRLFARLLLKDCQSVSTKDLTNSFGWTNDEQFQQHDVQELNRILFSAIESSLVGTSGHNLIQQLYHGKIVNQIRCTKCSKVSERQEDFLDVPVTVAGSSSLEQSLHAAYCDVEMLDGKNQYRCGGCKNMVDAEKGAKLKSLPSILTISLLRFSFDYQKMERFKETGKFTFPHTIDMRQYCDNVSGDELLDYELFSVVIHMGGAYGGHYHAYIRDVDSLGQWVTPEDEEIVLPTDPTTGNLDVIECDSPVELVQVILGRQKNKGMPMDKLGQEILNLTGQSWNNRFKKKYGPLTKFLISYDDKFICDSTGKHVSLKMDGPRSSNKKSPSKSASEVTNRKCNCDKQTQKLDNKKQGSSQQKKTSLSLAGSCDTSAKTSAKSGDQSGDSTAKTSGKSGDQSCDSSAETSGLSGDQSCDLCSKNSVAELSAHGDSKSISRGKGKTSEQPLPGHAWFDFNDSRVHPIYEKTIEKQFSGKESAYMLFYRKKSLVRPNLAFKNKRYCMSDELVVEMEKENCLLDEQRREYDIEINKLTLQVHFSPHYQYREGALKPRPGIQPWIDLVIDQRKSTAQLYQAVIEMGMDYLPCDDFRISKFRELPSGGHIYDTIQDTDDLRIINLDISSGSKVFVWDGEQVDGEKIPTGVEHEPVYITVIYGENLQFSQGYTKSWTLLKMKTVLCDIITMQSKNVRLKQIFGKDSNVKITPFSVWDEKKTLAALGVKDGDQFLAEDTSVTEKGSGITEDSVTSAIYSCKFMITVEDRCSQLDNSAICYPSTKVEVERTITVAELKMMLMTKLSLGKIPDGGRLRIDHDTLGLRQPIHEELTVFEAGITQGSRLVLEPGPAPQSDEITLSFTCESSMSGPDYSEVMVKRNSTVGDCLQCILKRANITEGDWHLRKTNWCGEAAELLDDPDSMLDNSLVHDGDVLLLERGRLPPKGFIRVPLWLHSTPESVKAGNSQGSGFMSWVTNFFGVNQESTRCDGVNSEPGPVNIGELEISRESTLFDLKEQIMTLVGELPIPTVDFMRLRLKEQNRLTTVLRDNNQTLKRLKLNSDSVLAIQILPEEEKLKNEQIVLEVCQRIPDKGIYGNPIELVWDTSGGASIHSLKQAVSNVLFIDLENICMAKHFHQKFEWMVLEKNEQGSLKGKKKGQAKNNLKQAPFHIKDGDTIGVKDMQYDPNNLDNFMTEEDEIGKIQLLQEMEEKRKMREERKKHTCDIGPLEKSRRPEVGITIKVADFS